MELPVKSGSNVSLGSMVESRESVAVAVVAWAKKRIKRRIMNRSIGEKELERLFQIARAAGDAEGYARAKFEMAMERAKEASLVEAGEVEKIEDSRWRAGIPAASAEGDGGKIGTFITNAGN